MPVQEDLLSTRQATDSLLTCIMDMGELLLTSGAEVVRVEDTIARLCTAYGFARVDVFSITSSIVVTVHNTQGQVFTQTRRISARNTDLQKVAAVNALSRQICRNPISVEEFQTQLGKIRQTKSYPLPLQCLAYALISAVFAVFFGGTAMDGCAAALSGILIFFTELVLAKLRMNHLLQAVLVSAFTAFVVVVMVRLGIGNSPEKITIGNIMLLIPGIAFTTSLRDLISGDTISGLVGLCEAVAKAIAIAAGFAIVLIQAGGIL